MSSATISGRRCALRRILRPFATACLAAYAAFSAHAATPVAVWDGDFTKTFAGYTLDLNGNAASEGAITIASKGVKVTFASPMANGVTVIYKYAGMTFDKEQALATVASGSNGSKFGVELTSENYPKGIYKDAAWGDAATATFTTASGSLALTYKGGSGTYAYYLANGACTQIYGKNNLHESGAQASGVNVGGAHSTEIPASTGTKISAIAIFNSVLSADEMATYKWPSDPDIISVNFGSNKQAVTAGTDPGGIVADTKWYNVPNGSGTDVALGEATVAFDAAGTWSGDATQQHLKGYLDENKGGSPYPINITFNNLSADRYDVYIYCESDDASGWSYKVVNGESYYADASGGAVPGTSTWGSNGQTSILGQNVMVVRSVAKNADGNITIRSERNGSYRGCVAAVQLVGHNSYTAEIDGDAQFSTLDWNPAKPAGGFTPVDDLVITNAESATLTFDAPVTAGVLKVVNTAGHALKMDVQKPLGIANYDFSQAHGGITFDASGLDGTELAKNAVAGAPYTHWILKGTLSGGSYCAVTLPTVPSGYNVEQVADKFGVRIVVTAPSQAQFGSVNMNFPGGRNNPNAAGARISDNSAYSGLMHGAFPIVGTSWNDVDASNGTFTVSKIVNADGTVSAAGTVVMAVSGVRNAYDGGTDVVPADRMLYGYIDDGDGPTFVVSNIPFEKFRVIVYRSTDNVSKRWSSALIGATATDAKYYFGPSEEATGGATVWGMSDMAWGTASAQNVIKEGVNYVVSDVLTGGTAYIKSVQNEPMRGCVPGIQIVEVGKIVEGIKEYTATVSSAGTVNLSGLSWSPTPFAPKSSDNIKITVSSDVTGEVVINLDKSDLQVDQFMLVSKDDATIRLTGNNPQAIKAWDFSGVKGRVSFGFAADYTKVVMGAYPRIGIAYPYTGTIQSGFEYLGTGNKLTLTTISGGSVVIGGSGTLHGTLDVTVDDTSVALGGSYTSPNGDVVVSCTHGSLTIPEGSDISVTQVSGNLSGTYGGGSANVVVDGKLTVAGNVTIQSGWSSPRGIHFTVNKTGSIIAENSVMLMANAGYNYCSLTVDGGLVKVRSVNVGSSSGHGASYNPALTVQNGGTLQLAEGVINQNNGRFSIDGGKLSAYSYNGSTGYTWSPTNTTVNGTVTFALNGLAIAVPGVLSGASAKVVASSSKSGGMLTLGAASNYSGGTEVRSGVTVKLGNDAALGGGAVSVATGATLDFAGHGPANAISISGTGVGDTGALVNTGTPVLYVAALTFAGDATIGGPAEISYKQGSAINLGGHALTVIGRVKLGGFTVQGGGRVVVGSGGTLASNGATSLGNADLEIRKNGTLNLSGGNHISCRDFASAGTVAGAGATLIVNGTFDATSAVTIPKLKLNAATLKGVGLTITDSIWTAGKLHIVVDMVELPKLIAVAAVPESKESVVIDDRFPLVNGSTEYALRHRGPSLEVVKGDVVGADVDIDSVVGWTNFEGLEVGGEVSHFEGSAAGRTNVNVVVASASGLVITQSFEYVAGEGGRFQCVIEGLDAGQGYDVSAYLTIEGAEVHASSKNVPAVTARPVDGWIDEDAKTFAGEKDGTGNWSGTEGVAYADGNVIAFTNGWEWIAEFQPTNDSKMVRSSVIKDIHYKMSFACPGLYDYEEPLPAVPEDWYAAVTLMADAEDNCRFAVVSNGVWVGVPVKAVPGSEYEVVVRMDEKAANVIYGIVGADGSMTLLATCPYSSRTEELALPLAGSGYLASKYEVDPVAISGVCQDANLFGVGDDEYEDFDKARAAAGELRDIVPLWKTRFTVSGKSGVFRILDQYGLLELVWMKWHHYFVTQDGLVSVYDYLSGNNWIEYADVAGVATNEPGVFVVRKPEGLAWIAESATNAWFYGTVVLGNDIDLTEMNWTPVAQFSGTFDGNGRKIVGLNNTNVVAKLGRAGVYRSGPTNDFGRTAFGLFATATNAVFSNVEFADVAVDNDASSVAALLGVHAGGDLSVCNVAVSSGEIVGGKGGTVAGIVGTAEDWGDLSVVNNTNAAQYVGSSDGGGVLTNWVAGILTVGGTNETVGSLVVTGNVNRGTVANVVRNDADGGNVAQIVAGTTWGTKYGKVVVTNNVADGEVIAEIKDHDGWRLGPYDEWLTEVFPVCNLAPAVTRFTEEDGYRRFVEANCPVSVPVDPVYRTARMLAGVFENGADNKAGWWIDTITTMTNGGNLWITGELLTNDVWQTVTVDRSIGFDLRGNTVCTVYDDATFRITHDARLSISNGTIIVPEGGQAFDCVGASEVRSNNIAVVYMPGDFYDRTVWVDGMLATMDMLVSMLNYLPSGTTIEADGDSGLEVDPVSNDLTYDGKRIATLAGHRSLSASAGAWGTVYVLELNEGAVPDFDLSVKSAASDEGEVVISLSGTHGGFYYMVQRKASLVEKDWSDASEWRYVATDGAPVSFELSADDAAGFYRIKVTDVAPVAK